MSSRTEQIPPGHWSIINNQEQLRMELIERLKEMPDLDKTASLAEHTHKRCLSGIINDILERPYSLFKNNKEYRELFNEKIAPMIQSLASAGIYKRIISSSRCNHLNEALGHPEGFQGFQIVNGSICFFRGEETPSQRLKLSAEIVYLQHIQNNPDKLLTEAATTSFSAEYPPRINPVDRKELRSDNAKSSQEDPRRPRLGKDGREELRGYRGEEKGPKEYGNRSAARS